MKKCNRCGVEKPFDEFYHRAGRNGRRTDSARHPRCKPCYAIDSAERRQRNARREAVAEKTCTICGVLKPGSEFTKNIASGDRLHSFCKPCRRARQRDLTYDLSPGDYDLMVATQGGVCAICLIPAKLVVDHCHVGGQVRGLLCDQCNHAIGKLRDDPELMMRAAEYVLRSRDVLTVR